MNTSGYFRFMYGDYMTETITYITCYEDYDVNVFKTFVKCDLSDVTWIWIRSTRISQTKNYKNHNIITEHDNMMVFKAF